MHEPRKFLFGIPIPSSHVARTFMVFNTPKEECRRVTCHCLGIAYEQEAAAATPKKKKSKTKSPAKKKGSAVKHKQAQGTCSCSGEVRLWIAIPSQGVVELSPISKSQISTPISTLFVHGNPKMMKTRLPHFRKAHLDGAKMLWVKLPLVLRRFRHSGSRC